MKVQTDKAIEMSAIRLSADETRAIMKAAQANGKTISDYRCCGLVDLGIMKLVTIQPKDSSAERKLLWQHIRKAANTENMSALSTAKQRLYELEQADKKPEKGYVLTVLGKQVARGISVKLNSQYSQVPC